MQLSAILALGASKPATGCLKTVQLSLILALGGPWGFVLPPAHGATQSRIPWGCDSRRIRRILAPGALCPPAHGAIQSRRPKQAPMVMLCQRPPNAVTQGVTQARRKESRPR